MLVEVRTPPQNIATIQKVRAAEYPNSQEISDLSSMDMHVYTVDVIGSSPVGPTASPLHQRETRTTGLGVENFLRARCRIEAELIVARVSGAREGRPSFRR